LEQAGHQKQRDYGQAEAQPGQRKVRQQRNRALAQAAQVPAHPDHAVEGHVYQRALIETVAREWLFRFTLRTVVGTVTVGIGDCGRILLDRADKWV
jgi:hypothetical protein